MLTGAAADEWRTIAGHSQFEGHSAGSRQSRNGVARVKSAVSGLKRRGGVYGGKGVPQSASGRARRAAGGDIRALFQPRGERGIFPEKLRRFCGRVPQHEGACAGVGDGDRDSRAARGRQGDARTGHTRVRPAGAFGAAGGFRLIISY